MEFHVPQRAPSGKNSLGQTHFSDGSVLRPRCPAFPKCPFTKRWTAQGAVKVFKNPQPEYG